MSISSLPYSPARDERPDLSTRAGYDGRRRSWYGIALAVLIAGLLALELELFVKGSSLGTVIMTAAAAAAAYLIYLSRRKGATSGFSLILPDYFYLAYLGWCAATSAWAPSPVAALGQVGILATLWLGCTAVGNVSVEAIVRFVVRIAAVLAVLSFLTILISPGLAFQPHSSTGLPELRGVFHHQLRLGAFMSVALVFIGIAAINGQASTIVSRNYAMLAGITFIIFACMAAALARSYTAYAVLAAPLAYFLSRRGLTRWVSLITLVTLAIVITLNSDALVATLGEESGDITLSGRTRIWETTYQQWELGPALRGFGYGSFNNPGFDYLWRGAYRPPHPHNSYLAALFETGLVGLILTISFIISQIVSCLRSASARRQTSYGLFLVIMSFLASLTGSNYAGDPSVLFGLTLLLVSAEARSVEFARKPPDRLRNSSRR